MVDTERLQITGHVDITDSWRLRIGQSVRVVPEISGADLPVEREVFPGRIVFIDTHIDPMNQTCKVLVNVDNRGGLLRAGLEARMEIDPRATADPKAPPPPRPPRTSVRGLDPNPAHEPHRNRKGAMSHHPGQPPGATAEDPEALEPRVPSGLGSRPDAPGPGPGKPKTTH